MAGSMRPGRRPGTWELRVELARDPVTGKRRWRSRTVTGSERQASRELARLVVEVGGLDLSEATGGTMSDLFERWITHLRSRGRAETTLYGYTTKWALIAPHLGTLPVSAVSPQRIDEAYNRLLADGVRTGTIAHLHRALRAMMSQARRWRMIDSNPVPDATPPAHHTPDVTAPDAATVRALIEHAAETEPLYAVYLRVSATLGTRRGETLALRWCDIGDDAIDVSAAMVKVPGRPMERKSTKTHASGELPVDATTIAMVRAAHLTARKNALAIGVALPDNAYIFTDDPAGQVPWLPDRASKLFEKMRRDVPGAEKVTLKSLRAFVATRLVDADVDVRSAQARLRHRSPQTTARHYSARRPEAEIRAAETVASALDN